MNEVEAFILGIIQGLTEFLPISSTGHLYLGRHLFGLDEAGIFLDTMLHVGTLIAVLIIYRVDIFALLRRPFSPLTFFLIIGTLPAIFAGYFLSDFFDKLSQTGSTIGWEFVITGTVLYFSERFYKGTKSLKDLNVKDALFIGFFQALAIFPAISRSGFTIVAALFRGYDRASATKFSFLLSIPAILGGVTLQGASILSGGGESIGLIPLIIAAISSCFFGFVAIKWMISYLQNHSLKVFAYYTWFLGFLIIVLQQLGLF